MSTSGGIAEVAFQGRHFSFRQNSDIAVACMVEFLVPAEATRSLFCRVIEYPSQWCFGARSAYSLW
jgi:hypothetical protein